MRFGNKIQVVSYVTLETYDKIEKERGNQSISSFVGDILEVALGIELLSEVA